MLKSLRFSASFLIFYFSIFSIKAESNFLYFQQSQKCPAVYRKVFTKKWFPFEKTLESKAQIEVLGNSTLNSNPAYIFKIIKKNGRPVAGLEFKAPKNCVYQKEDSDYEETETLNINNQKSAKPIKSKFSFSKRIPPWTSKFMYFKNEYSFKDEISWLSDKINSNNSGIGLGRNFEYIAGMFRAGSTLSLMGFYQSGKANHATNNTFSGTTEGLGILLEGYFMYQVSKKIGTGLGAGLNTMYSFWPSNSFGKITNKFKYDPLGFIKIDFDLKRSRMGFILGSTLSPSSLYVSINVDFNF